MQCLGRQCHLKSTGTVHCETEQCRRSPTKSYKLWRLRLWQATETLPGNVSDGTFEGTTRPRRWSLASLPTSATLRNPRPTRDRSAMRAQLTSYGIFFLPPTIRNKLPFACVSTCGWGYVKCLQTPFWDGEWTFLWETERWHLKQDGILHARPEMRSTSSTFGSIRWRQQDGWGRTMGKGAETVASLRFSEVAGLSASKWHSMAHVMADEWLSAGALARRSARCYRHAETLCGAPRLSYLGVRGVLFPEERQQLNEGASVRTVNELLWCLREEVEDAP